MAMQRAVRLALLTACLCGLPLAGLAQTVAAIGGGLRYDNTPVWQRLVDAAGGPDKARFVVLPTASEIPQQRGEQVLQVLRIHGASAELIPLAPNWPGLDAQAVRDDPAQVARIAAANAVFFTGGSQGRIVDLLQPGGEPTPMLQAIRGVLARGGLIAGTSAGAAILSRQMFRDAPRVLDVLAGQLRPGQEIDRGLGFVPDDLFIDQHVLKRGRLGRMLPMMQRAGFPLGLGVADNSAVLIHPDGDLEVLGETGALLVDLREARRDPALPGFNLQGARLSYLEAGDRHSLKRAVSTIAAGKQPATATPADPLVRPVAGPDLLADSGVSRALEALLESGASRLVAVSRVAAAAAPSASGASAVPAPATTAARPAAFEFRLIRDGQTRAWRGAGAEGRPGFSVERLRIDVQVAEPQ
jgi:cyanophycinase